MTAESVLLAILFAMLLACSGPEQGAAEEIVRQALVDPQSANFADVATNGEFTCGSVNAKNTLGGYVGFRPFIVHKNEVEFGGGADPAFAERFFGSCPYESSETFRRNISAGAKQSLRDLEATLN